MTLVVSPQPHILATLQSLAAPELMILGIVALLIFGRRLPAAGRSFDATERDWSEYAMAAIVVLFAVAIVAIVAAMLA